MFDKTMESGENPEQSRYCNRVRNLNATGEFWEGEKVG